MFELRIYQLPRLSGLSTSHWSGRRGRVGSGRRGVRNNTNQVGSGQVKRVDLTRPGPREMTGSVKCHDIL